MKRLVIYEALTPQSIMKFAMSRTIRQLIIYDFAINFAFELISPIFAIFILSTITGSSLKVVGLAATFYWLARALTTVPLSRFMDRTDGERDEFYFALVGSVIVATVPLMYLLANQPWHVYLIQFIFGVANSISVPARRILFTDHIDEGKVGLEWSLDDVGTGVAVAVSSYLGSVIADAYGFRFLLIFISVFSYAATFILMPLYKDALTLREITEQNKLKEIKNRRKSLYHVQGA